MTPHLTPQFALFYIISSLTPVSHLFLASLSQVNHPTRLHVFRLLTLYFNSSLLCLTSVSFFSLCLCVSPPLSPPLPLLPRKPRGCLYSQEDVEVIEQQEKLSLSHFNQLVCRNPCRKKSIFTLQLLKSLYSSSLLSLRGLLFTSVMQNRFSG